MSQERRGDDFEGIAIDGRLVHDHSAEIDIAQNPCLQEPSEFFLELSGGHR